MACHFHVNHFFESSLFTMDISSWMIFNLTNYVPLGQWTLSNLSSSETMVPWGKWAQVLQELTVLGANGFFHPYFANIFPNFHSICAFHPRYANLFSTFHCEMLRYIDENYVVDESWKQMMTWYEWKVAQWMKSWKIIATRPTFAHFLLATWLGFSSPHSLNNMQLLIFMDFKLAWGSYWIAFFFSFVYREKWKFGKIIKPWTFGL
jgi:hypothetical protein